MKTMKKFCQSVLLMGALFVMLGIRAHAQEEQFTAGTVWGVTKTTEVKAAADDAAETVGEIKVSDAVIVAEDAANGWCKVQHQSIVGYIPTKNMRFYQPGMTEETEEEAPEAEEEAQETEEQAEEVEEETEEQPEEAEEEAQETEVQTATVEDLTQEFNAQHEIVTMGMEEYEQVTEEKKTAGIWGIVIGVLVVAIFAVGIISALKGDKGQSDDKKEKTEAGAAAKEAKTGDDSDTGAEK
ncbi:MAG: SH3 domain-containing protein [Lachnospiraceae bacterium]|nr:SH3 domain-containing protein [Lachnospiraceae bacterium]